jgi:transcriptional regulator with XRE-family HTH domain
VGLTHETGVDKYQIIHIEQGRGEGRVSTHLKLAQALGVSLDEYFGFGMFQPIPKERNRFVQSRSSATVETLAPLPGSPLSIKRIHLAPWCSPNIATSPLAKQDWKTSRGISTGW